MAPRLRWPTFVLLSLVLAGRSRTPDPVEELEDRRFAPCCWRQALRDHESPIATQLRAEISARQEVSADDDARVDDELALID
jgi:hypothetical protein